MSKETSNAAIYNGEPAYPGVSYIVTSVVDGAVVNTKEFTWDEHLGAYDLENTWASSLPSPAPKHGEPLADPDHHRSRESDLASPTPPYETIRAGSVGPALEVEDWQQVSNGNDASDPSEKSGLILFSLSFVWRVFCNVLAAAFGAVFFGAFFGYVGGAGLAKLVGIITFLGVLISGMCDIWDDIKSGKKLM